MPTRPRSLRAPAWWLWAPAAAPALSGPWGWLAPLGLCPPALRVPPGALRSPRPAPVGCSAGPPLRWSALALPVASRRWCGGALRSGGAFRLVLSVRGRACRWCLPSGCWLYGGREALRPLAPLSLPLFRSIWPLLRARGHVRRPRFPPSGAVLVGVPWVPLSLWPLPLCVYRTYVLIGVEKPVECVYNRNKCRGKE